MLELADADGAAAQTLANTGNRYAAYHVQQAVEKLVKALLLFHQIESGIEHHLDVLIARLPASDPWQSRLRPLEKYTPFATTFRYPTPGGRIPPAPPEKEVLADAGEVRRWIDAARKELLGRSAGA